MAHKSLPVRILLYSVSSLLVCYWVTISNGKEAGIFAIAYQMSYLVMVFDVFSFYNLSKQNARLNAISNAIGLTISLSARWIISNYEMSEIYFIFPIVVITLVPVSMRYIIYRRSRGRYTKVYKLWSGYSKEYFVSGAPIFFASLGSVAYSQFSGYYLANQSISEFAYYSAALSLGSTWSFIPAAVISSFLPSIYSSGDITGRQSPAAVCFGITFIVCAFSAIGASVVGYLLIPMLYSQDYHEARYIIAPISAATLLASLNYLTARVIYQLGGRLFLIKKSVAALLLSIVISPLLIIRYGAFGAGVANIVTEAISLTILNYFYSKGGVLVFHINGVKNALDSPRTIIRIVRLRIKLRGGRNSGDGW